MFFYESMIQSASKWNEKWEDVHFGTMAWYGDRNERSETIKMNIILLKCMQTDIYNKIGLNQWKHHDDTKMHCFHKHNDEIALFLRCHGIEKIKFMKIIMTYFFWCNGEKPLDWYLKQMQQSVDDKEILTNRKYFCYENS